jgi:hypothetical protein
VEIDSREILKVRKWKRESLDRQVWRRHLKEAKVRQRAVAPEEEEEKKKDKQKKKKKKMICHMLRSSDPLSYDRPNIRLRTKLLVV